MKIIETPIPGLVIIEPRVLEDTRGYFFESYQKKRYLQNEIKTEFIQDNESKSVKGVVRGLHYQLSPFAQAKLVRVVQGSVFDVAVDLRKGSPTFGKWFGVELNDNSKKQLFVPRGFAHGFSVLSETAIFTYKCDNSYNNVAERSINLNDPKLNIDWQIKKEDQIVSEKDLVAPLFENAEMNLSFNSMKILITGANGQLGNEIKECSGKFPEWEFTFTDVEELDITNERVVFDFFQETNPDFVINCAAYTAVDKAENDFETANKINALAPGILAKAAAKISAKIIHISTDYVFDGTACKPLVETENVNPTGVYGRTKLEGEQNCRKENPESLIIRTSWLYSSFGNNFVKTMLRLGRERDELNVVFDQIGTPTYAGDLADAILSILENSAINREKFVPGIYHYSNEGVASWYDFAKAIFEISGLNCNVTPVLSEEFPTPAKRPNYSVLNKLKIRNTFALYIPYWKDSLRNCIDKLEN